MSVGGFEKLKVLLILRHRVYSSSSSVKLPCMSQAPLFNQLEKFFPVSPGDASCLVQARVSGRNGFDPIIA